MGTEYLNIIFTGSSAYPEGRIAVCGIQREAISICNNKYITSLLNYKHTNWKHKSSLTCKFIPTVSDWQDHWALHNLVAFVCLLISIPTYRNYDDLNAYELATIVCLSVLASLITILATLSICFHWKAYMMI